MPSLLRIGQGYDVHQLVPGRDLILGGVKIPHPLGLLGHSDADVALHALTDALLGAANLGDIGCLFPDTDQAYKGADSLKLLAQAWHKIQAQGWSLNNADVTILAQRPKLRPHIPAMQAAIAQAMGVEQGQISIKATTTEKLGFVGREEGIAAQAVALLSKEA